MAFDCASIAAILLRKSAQLPASDGLAATTPPRAPAPAGTEGVPPFPAGPFVLGVDAFTVGWPTVGPGALTVGPFTPVTGAFTLGVPAVGPGVLIVGPFTPGVDAVTVGALSAGSSASSLRAVSSRTLIESRS